METYPVIYLALLQFGVILFSGALTHRGYGEYVWALLAVPAVWTTFACWMQVRGHGFWSNSWVIYLLGTLVIFGLVGFFSGRGLLWLMGW